MSYRIVVNPIETTEGIEWIAEYPDIKYCSGSGKTPQEAIEVAEKNKERYLKEAAELGEEIPAPIDFSVNKFSGKFTVRVTKKLHKEIAELSEKENVSINHLITEALTSYVSKKQVFNEINDLKSLISCVQCNQEKCRQPIIQRQTLYVKIMREKQKQDWPQDEYLENRTMGLPELVINTHN